MICNNIGVNEKDHLTFAGLDVCELAKKYGTPLYLMDEGKIRENCRTYKEAMGKYFKNALPAYASKAAAFKRMYEIISEEGLGIDVVSVGEIYTAMKAGFPLENAYFHSNNKTDFDVEFAIENGVGYFVVDNEEELFAIERINKGNSKKQKVLLRLTPGIDTHTYEAVNTGKVDYVDVTFDLNGGHTISGNPGPIVKSVPVGSWVILLDAPRKDSSIFECWHTDDKTVKVSAPYESFQVMNSITFTAKWLDEELPYVPTAEEESLVSEFSFVPLEGVEILDLTEAAVPEIEEEAITDAAGEASPAEEIPIVQLPDENVPAIEETAADAEKAQPAAISISAEVPAAEIGSLLTIPATLRVEVAGSTLEIPVNVNISLATPAS